MYEGIVAALFRYADFNGRSRRSEFFSIFIIVHLLLLGMFLFYNYIEKGDFITDFIGSFITIVIMALQIPTLAALVRRLHDIDKEGRDIFVVILPIVGPIFLFMWCCRRGTVGENRFGPDPLAPVVPEAG
jgi:uncharacterized membrane protein YhaH (DUF805 family)